VDVEGGNATLFVSLVAVRFSSIQETPAPALFATPSASCRRKRRRLNRIDHLITTHWHGDHYGGLAELAARVPIRNFIDHGPNVQPAATVDEFLQNTYPRFTPAHACRRATGDRIAMAGLDVRVVTSAAPRSSAVAGSGRRDPYCAPSSPETTTRKMPMSSAPMCRSASSDAASGRPDEEQGIRADVSGEPYRAVDVLLGLHHDRTRRTPRCSFMRAPARRDHNDARARAAIF